LRQTIIITVIALSLAVVSSAQTRRKGGAPRKTKPTPAPTVTPKNDPEPSPKELAEAATASRAKLMEASQAYRESLERLLELQKQDETRAADLVKRRQELLDLGVVAKRDVEEGEAALKESQKKIEETNARLNEVDQLVAEVTAAEQLAKQPPEKELAETGHSRLLLVRYTGRSNWSLANDYLKVDAYFRQTFGRALPVSAFGQTETHNRLGFDHTNALDVAIHPDSTEGQALQAYLRAAGISFIAIRGAITGSATGAHIHIGAPSRRSSL
jgi:hypothetical protein